MGPGSAIHKVTAKRKQTQESFKKTVLTHLLHHKLFKDYSPFYQIKGVGFRMPQNVVLMFLLLQSNMASKI